MTLFLFASLFLFVSFFYPPKKDLREAAIKSYIAVLFLIASSTEAASFFDAVTYNVVSAFWTVVTVSMVIVVLPLLKISKFSLTVKKTRIWFSTYGYHERILIALIGIILSTTLLTALLSPPNNWDSMTYHMSRVAQWIQHKNVDFYTTSISRQNFSMPLAEFAILHLQLLSKSDRFANMIQWYSLVMAVLLASGIAGEFKASRFMQLFSGLVVATIPMAILQSSSTQNDLVTGALCLGFAYFLLRVRSSLSFQDTFFCASTFGLALLCKGTAYIYCCSIGLMIGGVSLFSSLQWKIKAKLSAQFGLCIFAALLINAGHFYRNFALYGHPLSTETDNVQNEEVSFGATYSNIVRNGASHLGTPFYQVNEWSTKQIEKWLGPKQLNDPKTTFEKTRFAVTFSLLEDSAGNPLHFLLIAVSLLILPFLSKLKKRAVYGYAASVLLSMILYSFLLKWQPWGSRLQTPLFMLSAPLVAVVLSGMSPVHHKIQICIAILLFVYETPFLLLNISRPLIPFRNRSIFYTDRSELYFARRGDLYEDYTNAVKVLMHEGEKDVGLYLGGDDLEYPIWALSGRNIVEKGSPKFRHVGVTDISNTLEKKTQPLPTLVLATKNIVGDRIAGEKYIKIFESKNIRVFKKK